MGCHNLTIGFVRRGFSSTGGAESYLKRLAAGVVAKGHQVRLYTSAGWPAEEWKFGSITRVKGRSAVAFADELGKMKPRGISGQSGSHCDLLVSLERIWQCDVYRAGDGVHRAWLERRARIEGRLRSLSRIFNPKHSAALTLEKALLGNGGADRVIANSQMVRDEIEQFYGFPKERIDVVHNGVPTDQFHRNSDQRSQTRESLRLGSDDIAVLFAGSGWARKGLRFAIEAVQANGTQMRLLVAGRGDKRKFRSKRVTFLDAVQDMPGMCAAADIFLLPTIYDPFSNACLEALAAGLPVVTTSANGFSEIIEDGTHGSIVDDPRNVDGISDALQFWATRERRKKAQAENQTLARKFDISINVERTLKILTRGSDR